MALTTAQIKAFRLYATLAFIVAVLIFNGWFLNFNYLRGSEQQAWVMHTSEVMSELDLALSSAKDAETGSRGYLLTKEDAQLEPFRRGQIEGGEHIERVRYLTIDNSAQQSAIGTFDVLFKKRVELLNRLVDDLDASSLSGKQKKILYDDGKAVMDRLRAQAEKMKETEQRLLITRTAAYEQSRYFFFWSLVLTTVLSIGIITFAFRQFRQNQIRVEKESVERAYAARMQESVAEIAKAVSGDVPLERVANEIQSFLARKLQMLAAKVFINDIGGLMLLSSFGVGDVAQAKVSGRRTLIDEAFEHSTIWEVKEVPENYWTIASSLGQARPRVLVFLPFAFQGRKLGVIEIALFSSLTSEQRELLSRISDTVGIGLNAAQSRERLQKLLEETQQQAEELQAQQEELKTNNEELEQQARALESQQQALNIKNNELEGAQADLETKAADLQRSSHYKSEFLAKMSHELRTPLNGLLILSTLLVENKEKNLTEQQLRFSQSIQSAGNDLLMLINDILDLSKIEARKLALRPEEFSLKALFTQKKQVFDPQADAKELELKLVIDPSVEDLKFFTDRQRLEQILRNFLSNAIKFTEKGTISLEARSRDGGKNIEIAVRDTGIGIPKAKQALVFEAFEQADSSVSRRFGGTGLGLTISRELAYLLGGDITVESEEEKGSVFFLRIPTHLKPGTEIDARPITETIAGRSAPLQAPQVNENTSKVKASSREADVALGGVTAAGRSILIVEDDEAFLQGIVEAAKTYGFEPIAAKDGEVALAILEKHTPHAILLDIKLPGISGLGLLEMIKHLPHLRHIPVHMISALDYQHNALRMGALGYLTKPVTMEKVRSALERIENLISDHVRRILLIEDDTRQREAISELVAGKDVEVTAVKNGKDAVAKLKSSTFDCIILDLSLPDISGFDLLSELNQIEISLPPIVIYTGKDLSRTEEEYLRKFSESIIIKGARSPERLLDEVNLFLHRIESQLPESKRAMLSHLRSQERNFENKTVLVVDDDMRNVFALTSALESKNLSVRIAKDGIEALEMLDKHSDIDLVMMDIMMPRMDGFEAMRRIRKSENSRIKRIPVIALTAKAMREDHEKCMEAGASDYLPKPVNLENLMTTLKVWLAPKELFQ